MIFKALWGIIKSLFGIMKWFFKRPIKCGTVKYPFDEWNVIGHRDILYKLPVKAVPYWQSGKLPRRIRRSIKCHGYPIPSIRAIGRDRLLQIVIELYEWPRS